MAKPTVQAIAQLGLDRTFYKTSWDVYKDLRGSEADLDDRISRCRNDPGSCTPLWRAWVDIIDTVNLLPENLKLERASVANYLLNESLMAYDHDKATPARVLFHAGNWLQTPLQTLGERQGAGICGDFAVLKYETLLRSGFTDNELRLVSGMTYMEGATGGHTLMAATVGGKEYVTTDDAIPQMVITRQVQSNANGTIKHIILTAGDHQKNDAMITMQSYIDGGTREYLYAKNSFADNRAEFAGAYTIHIASRFEPAVAYNNSGFESYRQIDSIPTDRIANKYDVHLHLQIFAKERPKVWGKMNDMMQKIAALTSRPVSTKALLDFLPGIPAMPKDRVPAMQARANYPKTGTATPD